MADRSPRETRDSEKRPTTWRPPDLLPNPVPQPGWVYRWVRTSTFGQSDPTNVSARLREGWEPVKAADHPELHLTPSEDARFKGAIEVGGLILCKIPEEIANARNRYYRDLARQQVDAVEKNFLRENDPRMPLHSQRESRTTFGSGNAE